MSQQYGQSEHYLGERGQAYFQRQSQSGPLKGELEARKFAPYVRARDAVIDFGCGGGFALAALQCTRRIGVEPNPRAQTVARENGIESYSSLAEVPDAVADVAIINHALEHIPFPIEALRQLKAKMRPGGRLIVCLPMEDWRVQSRYNPKDIPHHLHAWNPQVLGNTLVEAGFDVSPTSIGILTHCFPPKFYPLLYRRLPLFVFNCLCRLCAVVLRRRQLVAVVEA
jgi:SAM-dependent methyltransferase